MFMDLKGLRISDRRREILNAMNIVTLEDIVTYYPYRYEQIEKIPFEKWEKGTKVAFEGKIISPARVIRFAGKRSVTKFKVVADEQEFSISLFNRPWTSYFRLGVMITIIGRYEGGFNITALQYNFKPLQEQLGIEPVYRLKDGISQKDMKRYAIKAYEMVKGELHDFIPSFLKERYQLFSRKEALYYIHQPISYAHVKQSLRYLKYEEFLKFQLCIQAMKAQNTYVVKGSRKDFNIEEVMDIEKSLSFTLTDDQKKVVEDILQDLKSDRVMYRMVQGDVGCGKTLVAAFAMYACVLSYQQAAFMAPTELLAKQHYHNLKKLFQDVDIQIDILYSSRKGKEKKELLQRLKDHEIDILVGTHALFQDDVEFYHLGLVIADEQHRFGVDQRRKLIEKGEKVDFLMMSATPIPRTLALSLYGDMDVSTIQQLPKGRMPITTTFIPSSSIYSILEEVLQKIDEGNQCYIVCPAIEKNEEIELRNVNEVYAGLCQSLDKKYCIGLLHGKMTAEEKDSVMESFLNKELQILVSTTVIEVGVDVKDANIIIIYDAHRFGLSQIHQLRGRVGRGTMPGYCYLISNTKDADSIKRLQICVESQDGFEIARKDLMIRGPGDILGTRQSGIPGFILGDVVQDANILEVAREDAAQLLSEITKYPIIEAFIKEGTKKNYLD